MGLDESKLESMKRQGKALVARCPACAEEGHDHKGNHLFIAGDGRFGCVLYPGAQGSSHRKRIFELVGIKERNSTGKDGIGPVRSKDVKPPEVVETGVLGRLGRLELGSKEIKKDTCAGLIGDCKSYLSSKKPVPNVPEEPIDADTLQTIDFIKKCFNGNVVRITKKGNV